MYVPMARLSQCHMQRLRTALLAAVTPSSTAGARSAIQNGDIDLNLKPTKTLPDADPYPNHPEYPAAHGCVSALSQQN
jgi:hypothetical protein